MYKFQAIDINGDGFLSRDELISAYDNILDKDIVQNEVSNILQECDVNGDGEVSFFEFLSFSVNRQRILTKDNLKTAFNMIDIDQGGTLDHFELSIVIKNSYTFYSEEIWLELKEQLSTLKELNYKEFEQMMLEKPTGYDSLQEYLDKYVQKNDENNSHSNIGDEGKNDQNE